MNQVPKPRTALRLGAAATAMTLAAVVASPSSAGAAPAGHGMAKVETTILDTRLANLLGLQILNDVGTSISNPVNGTLGGVANLAQIRLTSGVVPALNKTIGEFTAKSPGGVPKVTTQVLDLGTLPQIQVPAVPVLGDVGVDLAASGKIQPAILEAAHVPASATSHVAEIVNANLLGGLASVQAVNSNDRTGSGTAAAEAVRNVGVNAITVLKLGDLLKMLGLDILKLPLELVEGLLGSLGLDVNLHGAESFSALVESLLDTIDQLPTAVDQTVGTIAAPVLGAIGPALVPLGINTSTVIGDVVTPLVNTVTNTLRALLQDVLNMLDGAALLSVDVIELGTVAKATDSVNSSVATATGRIGAIKVGNLLATQGLDVLALAETVNSTIGQVQNLLNGVLVPLGLGNILEVKLFEKDTSVQNVNGVIKAASSITGLKVRVNIPAVLAPLTGNLNAVGGITGGLGLVTDGLLGGAVTGNLIPESGELLGLDVVKIASTAEHAIPASSVTPKLPPSERTPTSLPRTGGDSLPFGLAAAGLTAAAVAASRARRRSQRQDADTTA